MIYVNGRVIEQNHFSAGELKINLQPSVRTTIDIAWHYESDAEYFTVACIRHYFSTKPCILYMPYLPHARMDRVKNVEDVFTLKTFANLINILQFDKVYVWDAHSNVGIALIDRCENVSPIEHIKDALLTLGYNNNSVCLFFPDEGAMKRYKNIADEKKMPYGFGIKDRDWVTGELKGTIVMNKEAIVGKDVLIIDDICSKGGTFFYAAKALKAAGAKSVSLYVTHCEKTIILGEMASTDGLVDHVYTTQSIFPEELFNEGYDPYWKEWITVFH